MPAPSSDLIPVGWREWIALPDLKIPAIKAKIDSGARTSCLHTASYDLFEKEGAHWVRFTVHPIVKKDTQQTLEAPVADFRIVRDSGGHEEKRPFITTPIQVGTHTWPIEISLSNRENMKFRMLLGRTCMADHLLIDCSKSYLTRSRPKLTDL